MTSRRVLIGSAVVAVVAAVATAVVVMLSGSATEPTLVATPTTTTIPATTTTTIPRNDAYVVATATVPVVQVVAFPPEGIDPAPGPEVRDSPTAPIPRPGLDTVAVRTTEFGFAYDNPTYFGNPLVFLVVAEHDEWVEVLVQARPNQQRGWVRLSEVELSRHDAAIELDLTTRMLSAYVDGEAIVDAPVSIGLPANPTPTGTYFITEVIPQNFAGGDFGPFVLATSAYSEQLDLFDSGMPIVAVHGTNRPDLIGQEATNGCVRLDNELITLLADRLPPGVPLTIIESPPADDPANAT
jgi:hypothetical protein